MPLADPSADGRAPRTSAGKAAQPDTSIRSDAVGTAIVQCGSPIAIEAVGAIALVGCGTESRGRWGRRRPTEAAGGAAQGQALIKA